MRARTLIVLALVAASLAMPSFARALYAGEPEPDIYVSGWVAFPPIPGIFPVAVKTGVHAGDTPRMIVLLHSQYDPPPSVSADFSSLGGSSLVTLATPSIRLGPNEDVTHFPAYQYSFDLPPLRADIPNGIKQIPITVTDANENTAATTTSIFFDNTPPEVSLTKLSFRTRLETGDTILVSGSARDADTRVGVSNTLTGSLLDASGKVLDDVFGGPVPYNATPISDALASSTDGSFTDVPLRFQPQHVSIFEAATSLRLTFTVYDEAGNLASSTLTVPLPKAPPPPFPPNNAPVIFEHHDASPPYGFPIGFPLLNNPSFFVASGTLASFAAPLAYFKPLTGSEEFSFALPNTDCQTPFKSADEWGITHLNSDHHAPIVAVGPFTGSACDITASSSVRIIAIRKDRPGREDVNMLVMGNAAPNILENFVAYGPPPPPAPPDPCATPGACVSSVLFIPGTEASRLYMRNPDGSERQLWEPSIASDISLLAMNPDGTSAQTIYTKDIVDSVYGNLGSIARGVAHLNPTNLEVYGDFEQFMSGLTASSTFNMHEWRAYPYDWRYDVRDIVANGTETEEPDGSLKRVYLEDVVAEMASSSATGKVTIIAHSNGGLVAKALMQKLANDGKSGMIDQLVMIGTPQWGTPVDIGSMLHGDGQTRGLGIISYGEGVRKVAAGMPGPYDLLPSPAYFARVRDPVASFANDDLAGPFAAKFSGGITSFTDLVAFVTNAFNLDATSTEESLNTPLALNTDLVSKAQETHAQVDAWQTPATTRVTSLVGWGQLTTFTYRYAAAPGHALCELVLGKTLCLRPDALVHEAVKTEDGDDTVVSPSAAGNVGSVWYFDASSFQNDHKGNIVHQDLTSAAPIQNTILDLLEGRPVSESYIIDAKPPAVKNPLHVISGRSPINLLATDAEGNETGIVPVPGTDFYIAKHDIPGSAVDISGEEKFIYLPQGESYSIGVSGYATGPANIEVQDLSADGNPTQTTTLADIPVVAGTTGSLTLSSDNALSSLSLDLDGDGTADASIAPTVGALTSYEPPPPASPTPSPEPLPPPATTSGGGGGGGGGVFFAPPPPPTPPPLAPAVAPAPPAVSTAPTAEPPASPPAAASEPSTSAMPTANRTVPTHESATPQSVTPTIEKQSAHDGSHEKSAAISSQAASAYTGLSEVQNFGVVGRMYHWAQMLLVNFWSILIATL